MAMLGAECCCCPPSPLEACADQDGKLAVTVTLSGVSSCVDGQPLVLLLEKRGSPSCDWHGTAVFDCGPTVTVTIQRLYGLQRVEVEPPAWHACITGGFYTFEDDTLPTTCEEVGFTDLQSEEDPAVTCTLQQGGTPPGSEFGVCPVEITFSSSVEIDALDDVDPTLDVSYDLCESPFSVPFGNTFGSVPTLECDGGSLGLMWPNMPDVAYASYRGTDSLSPFGVGEAEFGTQADVMIARICYPGCGWVVVIEQVNLLDNPYGYPVVTMWVAVADGPDLPAFDDLEFELFDSRYTFLDQDDNVLRTVSIKTPISEEDQDILDAAIADGDIPGTPTVPALATFSWT